MTNHTKQTLGLTDGRRKSYQVRGAGGYFRFTVSELRSAQSRSAMEFNASMATLLTVRLINVNQLNIDAAINVSALYEAMLLQGYCLIFPVCSISRLWNRQNFISAPTSSGSLYLTRSLRFLAAVSMPRSRGIPRRGGRLGIRGCSPPVPEQVAPIALAPPSSPPLEQDRILPNNSYQTSRFIFQSQLNRPVVTVNFTVFISEEENYHLSSSPPPSSPSQDDSILLGDMTGLVFHADRMQEDAPVSAAPQQLVPAQENDIVGEPSQKVAGLLHLVTDSDGMPVLDDEGLVTWFASPSQAKKASPASSSHAD